MPILYIGYPLVHLLFSTSLSDLAAVLANTDFGHAVFTSILAAICSTVLAVCFGIPTAYMLARTSSGWKRVYEGLLILPLILPPLVGGIAELNTVGPLTPIGGWFASHGVPLTDSFVGLVIAQSFVTSPFLIFSVKAGFEDVPKELHEAAKLTGVTWREELWSIYLPLSMPSIITGMLLTFTRAIGEFGASMMVSYHPYSIPVYIWVQFNSDGLSGLVPIAALIVIFSMTILIITGRIQKRKG